QTRLNHPRPACVYRGMAATQKPEAKPSSGVAAGGEAEPGYLPSYELIEVAPERPSIDPRLRILEKPACWCPACGYDLTLVPTPPCPRCERPFIPGDPTTTSSEPIDQPPVGWSD